MGREGCENGNLLYKNKCREVAEAIIQIWADTTLPLVKLLDKILGCFSFYKGLKNLVFFSSVKECELPRKYFLLLL